jgi:hypothetical protein
MALIERENVSSEQADANRKNAAKSTGPRTPRGKLRTAANAVKHGLYARSFLQTISTLGEDPREFEQLHQGLRDAVCPVNQLEANLVADLAKLWWQKARAERAQAAYQTWAMEKLE